uniref:CBM21 domain-containing protein n=1 Tax=Amphiprion ocellaris TaxID=80972 RepID=A0A3Q1BFW3_AMPOC
MFSCNRTPSVKSRPLPALPSTEKGVMAKREELGKSREQDEAGMEASTSTTDEETDDDSEPEPPLVVCRKVSFADAFGLNLVSVKEFDNAEVAESEVSQANERDVAHSSEEFYISCLFSVPSSQEELDQKLEAQMVELESIELLPGTTTLRGIVRVVNLCYSKCVFARITLDRWNSYFDLLAEYVPGSSDRKTDRFTFRYTLLPPFERDGARVEFCLRYETSTGTFWANNSELNYVLFCHQKGHIKENIPDLKRCEWSIYTVLLFSLGEYSQLGGPLCGYSKPLCNHSSTYCPFMVSCLSRFP